MNGATANKKILEYNFFYTPGLLKEFSVALKLSYWFMVQDVPIG